MFPSEAFYKDLKRPVDQLTVEATQEGVNAFLIQLTSNVFTSSLQVEFRSHLKIASLKERIKKILGKKTSRFLAMSTVNELVLNTIITQLRNKPYHYSFDQQKLLISLKINLSE